MKLLFIYFLIIFIIYFLKKYIFFKIFNKKSNKNVVDAEVIDVEYEEVE